MRGNVLRICRIVKLKKYQTMSVRNLLLLSVVGLFLGCSCGSKHRHGDVVVVKERCIWALTDDAYERMTEYCNRRDERALENMETIGLVGILEVGDKGTITDLAFDRVKIRLDDNSEVWVANKFVR